MNDTALLPSCYLPPVGYLWVMRHYRRVIVDVHEHYVKQTYRTRCRVASPNGVVDLTVPVEGNASSLPMRDVILSEHGDWRRVHLAAFDSYYRHTPYYDYYRDDLLPFYRPGRQLLVDYNAALLATVCDLMGIECRVEASTAYVPAASCTAIDDFRGCMTPKADARRSFGGFEPRPYYQVFAGKLGFIPDLSCVDLLFNMGPEAVLWL